MIDIALQGSGPWKLWYPRDSITQRMTHRRSMPSVAFLSPCRWLAIFRSEDEPRTAQGDGNALASCLGLDGKRKSGRGDLGMNLNFFEITGRVHFILGHLISQ